MLVGAKRYIPSLPCLPVKNKALCNGIYSHLENIIFGSAHLLSWNGFFFYDCWVSFSFLDPYTLFWGQYFVYLSQKTLACFSIFPNLYFAILFSMWLKIKVWVGGNIKPSANFLEDPQTPAHTISCCFWARWCCLILLIL